MVEALGDHQVSHRTAEHPSHEGREAECGGGVRGPYYLCVSLRRLLQRRPKCELCCAFPRPRAGPLSAALGGWGAAKAPAHARGSRGHLRERSPTLNPPRRAQRCGGTSHTQPWAWTIPRPQSSRSSETNHPPEKRTRRVGWSVLFHNPDRGFGGAFSVTVSKRGTLGRVHLWVCEPALQACVLKGEGGGALRLPRGVPHRGAAAAAAGPAGPGGGRRARGRRRWAAGARARPEPRGPTPRQAPRCLRLRVPRCWATGLPGDARR